MVDHVLLTPSFGLLLLISPVLGVDLLVQLKLCIFHTLLDTRIVLALRNLVH